ncbi:hypothetical protein [Actinophytocola gossypii]|uniref:Uncharacterized protein n=1 Tax=Actinophytocola gossypii TaxID=2812003 RepID=A0ABT2JEG5_9PSEU|nr:hypothetical protein [Actinophytocola gossypii]MCT2586283.1 hypothetical protein [Actinophytocola gossypii]
MRHISANSFLFTLESVNGPSGTCSTRLTTGLWLATDSGGLHIFNALDENGLSAKRED